MYEYITQYQCVMSDFAVPQNARDDDAVVTARATRRAAFASDRAARRAAPASQGRAWGARCATGPETTPVISAFEYISGNVQKMFAANANKLYERDVRQYADAGEGRTTSGNYSTSARHR